MELLLGVGIVLGSILVPCLLVFAIHRGVVWFAERKGYTADTMPISYHLVCIGVYFSVLLVAYAVYLTLAGG
jgi:hypothetical protein